ncbi:hypothetical protein AB0O01_02390 [Streptomyces sp. NPDC093252]
MYHWPRIYRYKVAEPGVRVVLNRYSRTIGVAAVLGAYGYCVKWGDA